MMTNMLSKILIKIKPFHFYNLNKKYKKANILKHGLSNQLVNNLDN